MQKGRFEGIGEAIKSRDEQAPYDNIECYIEQEENDADRFQSGEPIRNCHRVSVSRVSVGLGAGYHCISR